MTAYSCNNTTTSELTQRIAALIMALLLTACGGGGGGSDEGGNPRSDIPVTVTNYDVDIRAQQIVSGSPAPANASATATLRTSVGPEIVASGTVSVSGINASAVTINVGYAGEDGAIAINLQSSGATAWEIPAGADIDINELRRLESTGYYVLVDSPQGQLRGQILPANWDLVVVKMNGDAVVPPVASAGTAIAGIAVNNVTGAYHARVTNTGLPDVIGANIREAFTGTRGNILLGLEQSVSDANVYGTPDINNVDASGQFSSTSIEKFLRGNLHLTVDTMSAPDGEVRGQLTPAGISVFEVELSDTEVVSPGGPPVVSSGIATAHVTYGASNRDFALALNTDLVSAGEVYVHQAPFGQNGSFVFSLMSDAVVPGSWRLPATVLTPEQDAALNDQQFYISVVTAQFIDGELRGQLTLGNSVSLVGANIDDNGGTLSLTDPAGATYSLVLEPGAIVDDTLSLSMRRTTLPDNLPGGLRALSAVNLGPDGTTFANAPVITISNSGAGSGTARLGYLISDDGATIELTPLIGDDFVLAAFPATQHSFEVPHFTTAGIAEIEIATPFPVPPGVSSAEAKAKHGLTELITFAAQSQLLGTETEPDIAEVTAIMREWFDDIERRSSDLGDADLAEFSKLLEEAVRATEISQQVGVESGESQVGGAFDQNVFNRVNAVLRALDSACAAGDAESFDRMLKWFAALERLYVGGLPLGVAAETLSCMVTVTLEPEGPLAAIAGSENLDVTATVANPAGADVTLFGSLGFRWRSEKGINTSDGSTVSLDASMVGLRESSVQFSYFRVDASAAAVIVPDHIGARGVYVTGSATCPDTDDNGRRDFDGTVGITSQTVQPISDTEATVSLLGSGAVDGVTISSLSVNARYDANTESRVSGTAAGALRFNYTETDPDTGESFPISGNIQLQGTAPNDLFSFPSAAGSDSFGCSLLGRVQIGAVM